MMCCIPKRLYATGLLLCCCTSCEAGSKQHLLKHAPITQRVKVKGQGSLLSLGVKQSSCDLTPCLYLGVQPAPFTPENPMHEGFLTREVDNTR